MVSRRPFTPPARSQHHDGPSTAAPLHFGQGFFSAASAFAAGPGASAATAGQASSGFFSSSSASSASTARRRRAANSSVTAAKRAASVTAAARYAAAVLQVAPTASPEELRAAFRKRALESHPDKANGSTDEFRAVKAAFDTLQGPGGSADRERTPRKRAPRQARKPTATAATPRRALSPRALARSQGIFPQCSASSIGLLF